MESELKKLIKSLIYVYPLKVSEKKLYSLLSKELAENLASLNILKQSSPDNFVMCPSCGAEHQALLQNDKFIANCDNPELAGVFYVSRDELIKYEFNIISILKSLAQNLKLEGQVNLLKNGAEVWNLGTKKYRGDTFTFFLLRSEEYANALALLTQLSNNCNPVLLFLGEKNPIENTDSRIISLQDLVQVIGNKLTWNNTQIESLFSENSLANPDDVVISRDVLARKQGETYKILFNQESNGAYEVEDKINRSKYYLLNHLNTLSKSKSYEKSKTAKELASSLSTSNKYILKMIAELNQLSQKHIQKDLILKQPQNKYLLNPSL